MDEDEIEADLERVEIDCIECGSPVETTNLVEDMIDDSDGAAGVICGECETDDGESGSPDPNQYAGTEERTDESVARVKYMSLARGTLVRYLEPGDMINLPADRVEVEALD